MSRLEAINLIRMYDFYLAVMALFSFLRRYPVYWDGLILVTTARGRWPRVVARMRQQHGVLLNWATIRPLAFALILMACQMIASRIVWPEANIQFGELFSPWLLLVPFFLALVPMFLLDCYFLLRVGTFDRGETEAYLDYAEKWAGTWKAKAVRAATFGRMNPDRMVDEEVKKGLEMIGQTVSWSMWWVTAQVALRLLFGLVVWLLWATRK